MAEKKKKFFEIDIPMINQKVNVLSTDEALLQGKIIKFDLTRILKGKNVEATIIIEKIDNILTGRMTGILVLPSFIRRMIRKSTSYIEDSFECNGIVIKPYMLTRKRVHRSVRKALRNETKKFICDYVAAISHDEIFHDILSGKLQKALSVHLKKIYPLAFCEIRIAKEVAKKQQ
jgi:ribosomal protein S3AE